MALFHSIDVWLLADTIFAILMETRKTEEQRQELIRDLEDTTEKRRKRDRAERSLTLAQFM